MLRHLAVTTALFAPLPALADVPTVTADTPVAHSFAAMVMGDLGQPTLLLDRGGDPHHVQLRPSQARSVAGADLVIWSGAGLAPWMERVVESLNGGTALDLSMVAGLHTAPIHRDVLFDGREDGSDHGDDDHDEDDTHDAGHESDHSDHDHAQEDDHDEVDAHEAGHDHDDHDDHAHEGDDDHDEDHAGHDHDQEHNHGTFDPHLWMTPENAGPWLTAIAAQLSVLDPDNASTYFGNATAATTEIDRLSAEITAILAPVGDAGLVMYHAAFGYFAEAFDLNILGTIALSDAADPGVARLAALRGVLAETGATCIFPEVNHAIGYVTLVAEDIDLRVGEPLDPAGVMQEPGAGLYAETLRALARTIADCVTRP